MRKQIIAVGNGAGNILDDWLSFQESDCNVKIYIDSDKESLKNHHSVNTIKLLFSTKEDIQKLYFDKEVTVILICCLGGKMGKEMFPEICKSLKNEGIPIKGVITLPFLFEGQRRRSDAITIIEEIRMINADIYVLDSENYPKDILFSELNKGASEILNNLIEGN